MGTLVFVGTYSEPILFGTGQTLQGEGRGIHAFAFEDGALHPLAVTEGVRNPSYLAFDPAGRHLYCVNEVKDFGPGPATGGVSAFRIDAATGGLTFLGSQLSHGTDPCHLIVDATGRHVLVANFASGSVCVLPIRGDGSLAPATQVVQHEGASIDPVRQTGPHAHAIALDPASRHAFVPDLGLDRVLIYRFEDGRLTPNPHQPWVATAPGAGPRQMVMHPGGGFAYLINELNSTMTAYAYDAIRGVLAPLQTLPTLPNDFTDKSTCAEVQIAPSGRFLYGSNRGHDTLAVYALDPGQGTMTAVGHGHTGGRVPRHFELSPDGAFLAAANQDTSRVVMFQVPAPTGLPAPTGHAADVGTPTCARFLTGRND